MNKIISELVDDIVDGGLTGLSIVGFVALIIVLLIVSPWISFWLAYLGGWFAKILIGEHLVKGFAMIGIAIPTEKIPLIAGTLGWIGGYFKSVNYASKSSK